MLIHPTNKNILAFSTTRDCKIEVPVSAPLFVPSHQVHGTVTKVIDEEFLELSPLEQALLLDGVDALCTNIPDICIAVKTADCIPVLIYDDTLHVVSAVHAGWKGTVQRIVERNIDVLVQTYGCSTANLHAIIGPGISLQSFEIGDEVYERFNEAGFPMEKIAQRFPARLPNSDVKEKWHVDLFECNRLQLIDKDIDSSNIHVANIDTFTNEAFFSARRMKECTGRIINGIICNQS